MKGFWTRRRRVVAGAVVALLLLAFWAGPCSPFRPSRLVSVSACIQGLQRKDSRLNQFAVGIWDHSPYWIQGHCSFLRPERAVDTRLRACRQLAGLGPKAAKATPDLVKALSDPVIEVRLEAVRALRGIGPSAKAAHGALLAVLRDPAYQVTTYPWERMRHDAALALAAIAPQEPEVVTALLDFVTSAGTNDWRGDVACELIRGTPEAQALFATALKLVREEEKAALVRALAESYSRPEKRLPVLLELLDYREDDVRFQAVRLLGEMGSQAAGTVPKLIELLLAAKEEAATNRPVANEMPAVARRYSRTRLPPAGTNTPASVPPNTALGVPRYGIRRGVNFSAPPSMSQEARRQTIILALEQIGSPARAAVPLLEWECRERTNSFGLRLAAAKARVQIDGNGPEVMSVLAAMLEESSQDDQARERVLIEIGKLGGTCDAAMDLIVKCLADPGTGVRFRAISCLSHLGPKAAPALPELRKLLSDGKFAIRLAAKEAIREIEGGQGTGARSQESRVRSQ